MKSPSSDFPANTNTIAANALIPTKKSATPAKTSAERIKKMRAWLGGRGPAAPDSFTAEDEVLYYGDGHSGWNR